jgi:type VI protein secretion system component VasK
MTFVTKNNESLGKSLHGPWSILHLFDQTKIEASQDPNAFHLVFSYHDYQARYELELDSSLHPFLNNLPPFKLQARL